MLGQRGALLTAIAFAFGSQSILADDLEKLQGSWETVIEQGGTRVRVVKTIEDNRETVEQFQGERLVSRHEVNFSLDDSGDVRVFRYRDGRVTHGPAAGAEMPDAAYVYRIEGDVWIAVFGVLKEDAGPIYAVNYQRVEANNEQ